MEYIRRPAKFCPFKNMVYKDIDEIEDYDNIYKVVCDHGDNKGTECTTEKMKENCPIRVPKEKMNLPGSCFQKW